MQIEHPEPGARKELDPEVCRRARISRDPRFDGEFFIGVRTTGIYCRPICPVRPPAEKNVTYYTSAALAAQAGFRPCLRCRPESAPNSPAWNGTSTTVHRAMQLIREGALNESSVSDLAARLGVGERYLRKLFTRELGVSPQAVALNGRLLFAKKLLAETQLPVTDVAYAAGFGSVRRFNSAVRTQFRLTPSALRRASTSKPGTGLQLQLHYRPPYDWETVEAFFQRHAVDRIEFVTPGRYQRNLCLGGAPAQFSVRPLPEKSALLLELELELSDYSYLMPVVSRVRRMFDLDANPAAIHATLGRDRKLAPLLRRFPGIRSPGYGSIYESAVRGIVGQQVSTSAARTVIGRLAASGRSEDDVLTFPTASHIAALDDAQFAMPGRRRASLQTLCRQCAGAEEALSIDTVASLKGVGPWTIAMINLRGAGSPDTFPLKDLGLDNAWAALPGKPDTLNNHLPHWRPWSSYAANLLWRSLST